MSSYRLIEAEKTSFPVQFMCRMLGVSRSGYYDWRCRRPSDTDRADAALTERVREIHRRSRETYGSPRIHAELRALGTRCSRKRVERLMREAGLRGCMRGRRRRSGTTRRGRRAPAGDLVKRNFSATGADRVWAANITYIATREGFLYLAFILDVHSRKIVGWAMENPQNRTRGRRSENGRVEEEARSRLGASLRPGGAVHGALFLRKAQGCGHQGVDGKDRECSR